MKKSIYFIIIIISTFYFTNDVIAQNIDLCNCEGFDIIKEADSTSKSFKFKPCVSAEKEPKFPGGEKELKKFIQSNSSYQILDDKDLSQRNDFERVLVCLEFNKNGNITNKKVRAKIEKYKLDAYKIIDLMPNWIPAKQMKNKVKGFYIFMIPYKKE